MQRDDDGGDSLEAQLRAEDGGAGTKARTKTGEDIVNEHRYRMSELGDELNTDAPPAGSGSPPRKAQLANYLTHAGQRLIDYGRTYIEKMKLEDSRQDLQQRVKKLEKIASQMELKLYGSKYNEGKSVGGLKRNYLNLCTEIRTAASTSTKLKTEISKVDAGIEELHQLYRQTANGEGTKIQEQINELGRDRDDIRNKLYKMNVSLRYALPLQKVWKGRLEEGEEKYKALQRRLIEAKVKADQSVHECTKEINELLAQAIPELQALDRDEQRYTADFRRLENRNLQDMENFLAVVSPRKDEETNLRDDPVEINHVRRKPIDKLKVLAERANGLVEQEIEKINNGTYQF